MIKVTKKPEFKKTFAFLDRLDEFDPTQTLEKYGALGVSALAAATPVDGGETAAGWSYKVRRTGKDYYKLTWYNNQVIDGGTPLILLIQYGHGTRGGGFVPGQDIINPALQPIYNALHKELLEEAIR
jgi:hypothetical protein